MNEREHEIEITSLKDTHHKYLNTRTDKVRVGEPIKLEIPSWDEKTE